MKLYAYCLIHDHLYFVFRSANEQPMELPRDFKKYTVKKIIEAIKTTHKKAEKNGCYRCLNVLK